MLNIYKNQGPDDVIMIQVETIMTNNHDNSSWSCWFSPSDDVVLQHRPGIKHYFPADQHQSAQKPISGKALFTKGTNTHLRAHHTAPLDEKINTAQMLRMLYHLKTASTGFRLTGQNQQKKKGWPFKNCSPVLGTNPSNLSVINSSISPKRDRGHKIIKLAVFY